jgi:hypothetical protein
MATEVFADGSELTHRNGGGGWRSTMLMFSAGELHYPPGPFRPTFADLVALEQLGLKQDPRSGLIIELVEGATGWEIIPHFPEDGGVEPETQTFADGSTLWFNGPGGSWISTHGSCDGYRTVWEEGYEHGMDADSEEDEAEGEDYELLPESEHIFLTEADDAGRKIQIMPPEITPPAVERFADGSELVYDDHGGWEAPNMSFHDGGMYYFRQPVRPTMADLRGMNRMADHPWEPVENWIDFMGAAEAELVTIYTTHVKWHMEDCNCGYCHRSVYDDE